MKTTLYIKNMVCNRCKTTVEQALNASGYIVESVELGQVILKGAISLEEPILENILEKHGFKLIKQESEQLIEEIKIALIQKSEHPNEEKASTFLSNRFNKSYSALSKAFSKMEGMTIEKYEINLKIEKVKELIQLGQLNFSEIAYRLNYKNGSHLARQFKAVTGLSMTEFKNLQKWDRKSLDQIV